MKALLRTQAAPFPVALKFTNAHVKESINVRLLELVTDDPAGTRSTVGCHNYGFNAGAMSRVSTFCLNRIPKAQASPNKFVF